MGLPRDKNIWGNQDQKVFPGLASQGQIKAFLETVVSLARCGYTLAPGIYPEGLPQQSMIGPGLMWRHEARITRKNQWDH